MSMQDKPTTRGGQSAVKQSVPTLHTAQPTSSREHVMHEKLATYLLSYHCLLLVTYLSLQELL